MEEQTCPECEAPNHAESDLCVNCGAPIVLEQPEVSAWAFPADEDFSSPDLAEEPPKTKRGTRIIGALIVAALIGGVVASATSGGDGAGGVPLGGGCGAVESPPQDRETATQHLSPPERGSYASNPPSSGPHYGTNPVGGVFSEERQPELWLHNLEHGHIVILYGPSVSTAVKTRLVAFARARRTLVVLAPSFTIAEPLVMVAWSQILRCQSPADPDAVVQTAGLFVDAFVGRFSPEGTIPASAANEI